MASAALKLKHKDGSVPAVVLMTDPCRRHAELVAAVRLLPPGSAVVLRHYHSRDRARLGASLRQVAAYRRVFFFVAADVSLARVLRADGIHLPEGLAAHGLCARVLLWRRKSRGLLSMSCHSRPALRRAEEIGADWVTLSPVFRTTSHPGAPCLGAMRFNQLARTALLPVLALGGLSPMTIHRLANTCAQGIAGVSSLCGERQPKIDDTAVNNAP